MATPAKKQFPWVESAPFLTFSIWDEEKKAQAASLTFSIANSKARVKLVDATRTEEVRGEDMKWTRALSAPTALYYRLKEAAAELARRLYSGDAAGSESIPINKFVANEDGGDWTDYMTLTLFANDKGEVGIHVKAGEDEYRFLMTRSRYTVLSNGKPIAEEKLKVLYLKDSFDQLVNETSAYNAYMNKDKRDLYAAERASAQVDANPEKPAREAKTASWAEGIF